MTKKKTTESVPATDNQLPIIVVGINNKHVERGNPSYVSLESDCMHLAVCTSDYVEKTEQNPQQILTVGPGETVELHTCISVELPAGRIIEVVPFTKEEDEPLEKTNLYAKTRLKFNVEAQTIDSTKKSEIVLKATNIDDTQPVQIFDNTIMAKLVTKGWRVSWVMNEATATSLDTHMRTMQSAAEA